VIKKILGHPKVKHLIRAVFVIAGSIQIAAQTYMDKGNSLGFNKETAIGVAAQACLPLVTLAQVYLDKSDPRFGRYTKPLAKAATKKLNDLT
jgi:hypothetical protein